MNITLYFYMNRILVYWRTFIHDRQKLLFKWKNDKKYEFNQITKVPYYKELKIPIKEKWLIIKYITAMYYSTIFSVIATYQDMIFAPLIFQLRKSQF